MTFGRLDKPTGHRPMSDINVTPMVDVMLVLLVIFIIAAPLMASRIEVDLPKEEAPVRSDTIEREPHVQLGLDAEGRVWWDDEPVADGALEQRLRQAALDDQATEVWLQADQHVPHGRVLAIMAMAQRAGLSRIGFVTDEAAGADAPGPAVR
ncbi:MAG: biopolymer transporter ExbD [Hydrogenophaga sp.]|jgi:biopolymer transport protein ExbD|uniref:ExbD/TolR family protein n=1 Tax=Hydrogenophaga sp. TaxID=1904254 RepID=UPI00261BD888|nr:biopolymer transporter ExbD [Hydrogenophaga sp.]MDD3786863.1 biopolymer transporter ExbD [Hydrogenophaga sp.]MDX9969550.1 biopolymer transporter ExbD [Hydrogenophaga sp.]